MWSGGHWTKESEHSACSPDLRQTAPGNQSLNFSEQFPQKELRKGTMH